MKKTNPLFSLLAIAYFTLASLACTKTDALGLAGNDDSGMDGGITDAGPSFPRNPVAWKTDTVSLAADDFWIVADGLRFTSKVAAVDVNSDPGLATDSTYTTLELIWMENGREMRLNIYFHADPSSWWSDEMRTFNAQVTNPTWLFYMGTFFKSAIGATYRGDVNLTNAADDPFRGELHFHGLVLSTTLTGGAASAGGSGGTATGGASGSGGTATGAAGGTGLGDAGGIASGGAGATGFGGSGGAVSGGAGGSATGGSPGSGGILGSGGTAGVSATGGSSSGGAGKDAGGVDRGNADSTTAVFCNLTDGRRIPAGAAYAGEDGCNCCVCTSDGRPVCQAAGCFGKSSEAGVVSPVSCQSDQDCVDQGAPRFCAFNPGCVSPRGNCMITEICPLFAVPDMAPFSYCGCDGVTYGLDTPYKYPYLPYSHVGACASGGTGGTGGAGGTGTGGAGGSEGGPADTYLACYEIADPSDFVEVIKTTAQGMCVRLMLESAYSPGFTLGLTIAPKGWGVWDTARWPSSAAPCTTEGTPKVATQASSGKGTVTINGYPYRAGFTVDVDLVLTYPIGDSGASETETLQANAIPSDFTCYALSRGTGGSSGTATGGAGGSGGSTGSSGGTDGGSTVGTGGTNCDPRDVVCDQVPPTCGQGQVPRVVASCYDNTCVPIDQCQCTVAEECPDYPSQYTCFLNSQHCNYWMP